MRPITGRLAVLLVSGFLGALALPGIGFAQGTDTPTQLREVSVERAQDGATVRLKTSGSVTYEATLIDSPNRLVIDLSGTRYAWSRTRLASDVAPVKEIRGSQFKVGVARVVVEMTRRSTYRIEEGPDGLVVMLDGAPAAVTAPGVKPVAMTAADTPAKRSETLADAPKADAPKKSPVMTPAAAEPLGDGTKGQKKTEPPVVAQSPAPSPLPVVPPTPPAKTPAGPAVPPAGPVVVPPATVATPAAQPSAPVAKTPAPPAVTPVAAESKPSMAPKAPVMTAAAAPAPPAPAHAPVVVVAQAQTSPATNGGKLITLDFKDADVLNLLRILAAESGRNLVAGDDVKGKVSVSLKNVTWEQALDTILEVRALAKIDKGGVIRVVSLDQLTKEREAQARVEEAKRRAEIETRTKLAEAELKETELAAKRLANEAAAEEARRRGPLREETIRLSYADPEEVARTLQGILGIPPEGTQPVSSVIPAPNQGSVPTGAPPIMEPPFSQLYGQGAQPRPAPLVSVSQDVLAKGITIRAHKPTNTIFIRHYEADLERIKKLVAEKFDVPLPQVKIEARMEILDRNALEAIGVQWGGGIAGQSGRTTVVGQGYQSAVGTVPGQVLPVQGGVLQADGSTIIVNPAGPRAPATNIPLSGLFGIDQSTGLPTGGNLVNLPFQLLPNAASQIPAAGIAFGIVGTNFNVNLALQALATQGKTRTLARPEIVTVENNKATVSLGEEIPYATVSSAGTQIQFKEALLKLDVTPTVIRERVGSDEIRKIKMVVVVENNSRGDVVNLGSGGTPPAINRRKAETQVLIKEGERLVIGGVTQSTSSVTVRKVPILGDIPVLGWLFKQRENFETGRELVVFVTPSLLRADSAATR